MHASTYTSRVPSLGSWRVHHGALSVGGCVSSRALPLLLLLLDRSPSPRCGMDAPDDSCSSLRRERVVALATWRTAAASRDAVTRRDYP